MQFIITDSNALDLVGISCTLIIRMNVAVLGVSSKAMHFWFCKLYPIILIGSMIHLYLEMFNI